MGLDLLPQRCQELTGEEEFIFARSQGTALRPSYSSVVVTIKDQPLLAYALTCGPRDNFDYVFGFYDHRGELTDEIALSAFDHFPMPECASEMGRLDWENETLSTLTMLDGVRTRINLTLGDEPALEFSQDEDGN